MNKKKIPRVWVKFDYSFMNLDKYLDSLPDARFDPSVDIVLLDKHDGTVGNITVKEYHGIEIESNSYDFGLRLSMSPSSREVHGLIRIEGHCTINEYHWRSRWLFSLMLFTRPCLQILIRVFGVIRWIRRLPSHLTRLKNRF